MFIFSLRLIPGFLYLATAGSSSGLYLHIEIEVNGPRPNKMAMCGGSGRCPGAAGLAPRAGPGTQALNVAGQDSASRPQHLRTPRCVSGSPRHHSWGPAAPLLHTASCTKSPDVTPTGLDLVDIPPDEGMVTLSSPGQVTCKEADQGLEGKTAVWCPLPFTL